MAVGIVVAGLSIWKWRSGTAPFRAIAATVEGRNLFLPEGHKDTGWPFIRGVNYDGRSAETNLADHWPAGGPPVLWSRRLGQGYSAFVAQGSCVYTQVQTLAGQSVVCLDADTGTTLWDYRYDWPYDAAGVYPGPRATPTIYEGAVYFASPSGLIGCLDAASGDVRWSVNVLEKYGGKGVDFGYSCSPTVLEGRIYLPIGGQRASMVALSASDGSEIWRAGDDAASYTPAMPITWQGKKLILGYLQNALVIHDRESGEIVWRIPLSQGYDEHSAWPIYREPHLWTAGPFHGGSMLRELTSTSENPKTVWAGEILSNDVMSSVLVGDHLYGFDIRDPQAKTHRTSRGVFRCLEWKTGKPNWTIGNEKQRKQTGPSIGHASLLATDGKLILLNDTGELILARANPERYEELGRATVLPGEIVWTPPILHRGRVYVRNHSQAVCVYVGEPELLEPSLQSQSKAAAELPRPWYRDWTSVVLPVEPEYAFDIPSRQWIANWFRWCVILLAASWCLAGALAAVLRGQTSLSLVRTAALSLAGIGGLIGTTLLSELQDEFIFTWPLALYAMLHGAVLLLPLTRRKLEPADRRRSLVAAIALLASAAAYFWLCRRLSLVFEWAFLAGYLSAIPAILLDGWSARQPWPAWSRLLLSMLTSLIGFALFYWSSVALLWLRY